MKTNLTRCSWANTDNALLRDYHDHEWGRPCHNNRMLFELLSLEIMQAGLSWQTVLNKRQALKAAFENFDYRIVQMLDSQLPQLLTNDKIIRNRRKILAIISNARIIDSLETQNKSFNQYLWDFIKWTPIQHHYQSHKDLPRTDQTARRISKQMKSDGFKFTGPVVIYSFMQAAGLVNDHEISCYRYKEITQTHE